MFIKVWRQQKIPRYFCRKRPNADCGGCSAWSSSARVEKKLPRMPRGVIPLSRWEYSMVVIPYTLITWARRALPSVCGGFSMRQCRLFTRVVGSFLTRDERLTVSKAIGVVIGFIGVVVLFVPELRGQFEWNFLGNPPVVALLRLRDCDHPCTQISARRITFHCGDRAIGHAAILMLRSA